jgi:GAF domain-containing protein/HAMP domain-containing protein
MNALKSLRERIAQPFANFWYRVQALPLTIKLIGVVILTIFVILTVQAQSNLETIQELSERDAINTLRGHLASYNTTINEASKSAASVALSIAQRSDVQLSLLAGDRINSLLLLNQLYQPLKDRYQVAQMSLLEPNGDVFLRAHNPSAFGDNLAYRRSTISALFNREIVAGVEIGPEGLGVSGVAPIYRAQQFIGAAEVGTNFDSIFFEELKQRTNAEFTMWVSRSAASEANLLPPASAPLAPTDSLVYYYSTLDTVGSVPPELYERALLGEEVFYIELDFGKEPRVYSLTPLYGFGNRILGVIEISESYANNLAELRQDQLATVALALTLGLATSLAIWGFSHFSIVRPLNLLTSFAEAQARGESGARAELKSGDEFGKLATTFNTLATQIDENRQELEARVAERTAQLEAINEVGRVASAILEPDTLITQIVNLVTDRFGYYYAAIFLVDDSGQWAVLHDATGAAGKALKARHHRLAINNKSMVGASINNRMARIALDVGNEPVRFNNPLLPNTRSEIALPLMAGNRVIGALDVQSTQESAFTEESISTLQNMANQVAIAVENARLFQETNANLDEIRAVHRQYLTAAWQERTRSGSMQYTAEQPAFGDGEGFVSGTPLQIREQTIGQIVLEVEEEMSPEQQEWVQAVASQVATALENARLVEESQQLALRERLSAAITEKIWSAVSVDGILQTAVREIGRALDVAEASIEINIEQAQASQEDGANNE